MGGAYARCFEDGIFTVNQVLPLSTFATTSTSSPHARPEMRAVTLLRSPPLHLCSRQLRSPLHLVLSSSLAVGLLLRIYYCVAPRAVQRIRSQRPHDQSA